MNENNENYQQMKIKALIPVRSGSVRVKNKNIAPFAGSSLLEIKIRQMLRIPELDGVVVNSNSDEMLQMAQRLGAETAWAVICRERSGSRAAAQPPRPQHCTPAKASVTSPSRKGRISAKNRLSARSGQG